MISESGISIATWTIDKMLEWLPKGKERLAQREQQRFDRDVLAAARNELSGYHSPLTEEWLIAFSMIVGAKTEEVRKSIKRLGDNGDFPWDVDFRV